MSSDDFLRDAISAARDHADDGADDGAATRLRIRESLSKHGGARRKRFTVIAAVIASLFGSTAFAYWAGWRPPWSKPEAVAGAPDQESVARVSMQLPDADRSRKRDQGVVAATPPDIAPSDVVVRGPEAAPAPTAPIMRSTPEPSKTSPSASTTAVAPTTRPPASTTRTQRVAAASTSSSAAPEFPPTSPPNTPTVAPTTPAPAATQPPMTAPAPASAPRLEQERHPDPELAAYGRAHNLHFRGSDPKAALAAWDAYLAAYPDGKLAVEARYDRALVLVKLARWAEARAALTPFATAAVGSYRQGEAAQILSDPRSIVALTVGTHHTIE